MAENKMESVAQLFGKKLGEEFVLSEHWDSYAFHYMKKRKKVVFNPRFGWTTEYTDDMSEIPDHHYVKCKITTKGLFVCNLHGNRWMKDNDNLSDLLTGRAVIIDG